MTLCDAYKELNITPVPYSSLAHFFVAEFEFATNQKPDNVSKRFKQVDSKGSRVWLLFGSKRKGARWECLQVAQSKKGALQEVESAIELAFRKLKVNYDALERTNSVFYERVCPTATEDFKYRELLYSMIGRSYEKLRFCFLDVDKYLGLKAMGQEKSDADRIVEICKNQYAEAKIARQTLAVYWRQYSPGIDGQTISYFADHPEEVK